MILGVIPQRIGSKRLNGKALYDLAGKTMTQNFIERCKRSRFIDKFVLAVPDTTPNNIFEDTAKLCEVDFFQYDGNENDVISRMYEASKPYNPELIVRLIIDNPLIEAREIDRAIDFQRMTDVEFVSNVDGWCESGYPDGLGCEVYTAMLLEEMYHYADDREHPHNYAREYRGHMRGIPPVPSYLTGYSHLKLDVNTKEEYEYIKSIYDRFESNDFTFEQYKEFI